jgi:hypothetical protein
MTEATSTRLPPEPSAAAVRCGLCGEQVAPERAERVDYGDGGAERWVCLADVPLYWRLRFLANARPEMWDCAKAVGDLARGYGVSEAAVRWAAVGVV